MKRYQLTFVGFFEISIKCSIEFHTTLTDITNTILIIVIVVVIRSPL